MPPVYNASITGYNGKEYEWMCGNDKCCARSNPPIAIKGRERVVTKCLKCVSINRVSRYK